MNGNKLRYAGLKGEKDYKKAIQIIKDGGYATDTKYVTKICGIIERWNLTQFDVKETATLTGASKAETVSVVKCADRQIIDITKIICLRFLPDADPIRSSSLLSIISAFRMRIIHVSVWRRLWRPLQH